MRKQGNAAFCHEVDRPYDRLFRAVFSDAAEAGGLLRSVLPAGVRERIDWGSLSLQEGTFLDDALRESESDLLYEAGLSGGDGGGGAVAGVVVVRWRGELSSFILGLRDGDAA